MLQKENPESLSIAKYFVKTLLKISKNRCFIEENYAFKIVMEAGNFNESVLVKKF